MAALDKERVIAFLSALDPDELQDLILDLEERLGIERVFTGWGLHPSMGAPLDLEEMGVPEFDVILVEGGDARIQVIRAIRAVTNLSLGESRALLDASPVAVVEAVGLEDAKALKQRLEQAGARVEIR